MTLLEENWEQQIASSETDAIKGMVKILTPIPAAASVNPGA